MERKTVTPNEPTRREFITAAGLSAAALALPARAAAKEMLVYIGTYTNKTSEGIYVYRLDTATGELKPASVAPLKSSPSFLAIDARRRFLYAVNEVAEFNGKKGGGVTAFAIDRQSGALKQLNQQPSPGVPCHVSTHPSGKWVLLANYGGGNVAIYPVNADGSLGAASDVAQHTGKGGDPRRQSEPHAHAIVLDAAGKYAFAPDLGIDKVMSYRLDAAQGKLVPNGHTTLKAAAGPRHFDFHPNGKFAYVINELDSTVTAFAYDKTNGALTETQTLATLPADFKGTNYCADIHVHPSGKFLYGSNRGHDSIVIYAVDAQTGKLVLIGHEATQGKWPRNFGLDPAGQWLLVANQNSDNIAVFRIDQQSGKLSFSGRQITISAPVCVKFIPAFR
jgi:6-phosphogluconolactonase